MCGGHFSICQNSDGIWRLSIEILEVPPTPRSSSFLQCSLSLLLSRRVIKTTDGLWISMILPHISELVFGSLNLCTAIHNMYSKFRGFSCLDYGCWIRKSQEIAMIYGSCLDTLCPQLLKVVFIASMQAGTFPQRRRRYGQEHGGAHTISRGRHYMMIISIETVIKD